jgi:hypothetical protein
MLGVNRRLHNKYYIQVLPHSWVSNGGGAVVDPLQGKGGGGLLRLPPTVRAAVPATRRCETANAIRIVS